MHRYLYQHGDHPLEGYTIQRAAGRGGFGEVYYALSDSGREVALKAVQNYEQIELRGITQCMNLKSPHLVSIFDVKYNDRGQPFVIMEYVSGPSLRTLINESPGGIGKQKAAFFLREIAKGLSYLHECGIVHRDLKPGNIFYENGYVKICDYGLTKAVSASRHSGHTITVGTVHYMAPEIGAGKYNFGIDIYALGVLLYEMLTGDVPFAGESPAEILMKHMSSEPELKNIDEPFAHVIRKALAKDPDERYQTVQEMVEDLFGEENIRNSVSQFAPEELSMIAQRVAAKAKIDDSTKQYSPKPTSPNATNISGNEQFAQNAKNFYERVDKIGRNVANKVDVQVDTFLGAKNKRIPGVTDPILPAQRYMLAFISVGIVSIGSAFLRGGHVFPIALITFIMMNIFASIILMMKNFWFAKLEPGSQWIERIVTPFIVAVISGAFGIGGSRPLFFPVFLSMVLIDWRRISLPDRQKRLSLGSALWAGILGFIFGAVFDTESILIAGIMAGTSLAIQAMSAFGEEVKDNQKTHQRKYKTEFHSKITKLQKSTDAGVVPNSLRIVWFVASIISLGVGLFLVIWGGTQRVNHDFAIGVAAGVDELILSVFFFIGACRSSFNGWFRYLVKPAIMLACVLTIVASSIYMGNVNLHRDANNLALFLIIFPSVLLLFIIAFPVSLIAGKAPQPAAKNVPKAAPGVSAFKRMWAIILCCIPLFGLQRFYVGKIWTGILWFISGGLFGIGQAIDFIMIIMGSFTDRYGLPLKIWFDKDEINHKTPVSQEPVNDYKAPVPEYKEPVNEHKEPLHGEQEIQTPEIKEQTSTRSFTSTMIPTDFHPFTYLCSGIGYILIFAGLLISISTGLRIPTFIAYGWPEVSNELQGIFNSPKWPEILIGLGPVLVFVMVIIATVFIVISRRYSGASHLIRALLAMIGIFITLLVFSTAMSPQMNTMEAGFFEQFNGLLSSGQIAEAFSELIRELDEWNLVTAALFFLASVVMLTWPAQRKQTILTDTQNQGVN
ncbi:MAG: protein kinase [Sedimentisphaerales bacterium]|nr:protein kinase [Sedimentisphaerales bacterium]